jgi:hypothetical protein
MLRVQCNHNIGHAQDHVGFAYFYPWVTQVWIRDVYIYFMEHNTNLSDDMEAGFIFIYLGTRLRKVEGGKNIHTKNSKWPLCPFELCPGNQ